MLEWLRNAGTFIVAIGLLVSFHEFGHFWMARRFGVRVLRFSVGFGKPLWLKRGRDGVEYAVGAIPLGGYVKLLDEREGPVPPALLAHTFNRQKLGARLAVYAAGPLFNFLLAVLLYWGMYLVGVPGLKPLLAQPPEGTPAAAAGVHAGDLGRIAHWLRRGRAGAPRRDPDHRRPRRRGAPDRAGHARRAGGSAVSVRRSRP